jgi:hypothetical protein
MKKDLFAAIAGLVLAASVAHAADPVELSPSLDIHGHITTEVTGHPGVFEPVLPRWEQYALTEVAYPDLANPADAERVHYMLTTMAKEALSNGPVYVQHEGGHTHVSRVYVGIVARSQADAKQFNAWLAEGGYMPGNLDGQPAEAVFIGTQPSRLAVLVAKGIDLDGQSIMPFAISDAMSADALGRAEALPIDKVIWTAAVPSIRSGDVKKPATFVDLGRVFQRISDRLGSDAQISVHTHTQAETDAVTIALNAEGHVTKDSDANLEIHVIGSQPYTSTK